MSIQNDVQLIARSSYEFSPAQSPHPNVFRPSSMFYTIPSTFSLSPPSRLPHSLTVTFSIHFGDSND